jgi:hypothetical protein
MKNKKMEKIGLLVLALQVIAVSQVAKAENSEKEVEISGTNVSKKSAKFGEYTGLNQSNISGNFRILGGDAYDGLNGTKLWELSGSDLGTTSRALVRAEQLRHKYNMSE